jgi:hypothetical protein
VLEAGLAGLQRADDPLAFGRASLILLLVG